MPQQQFDGIKKTAALRQRIIDVLMQRPQTFTQLLNRLSGVSASDIQKSLSALERDNQLSKLITGLYVLQSASYPLFQLQNISKDFEKIAQSLPLPHELDSDWRFTFETTCQLVQLISHKITPQSTVACLTVPSLAILLALSRIPKRVVLIEGNPIICDFLKTQSWEMDFDIITKQITSSACDEQVPEQFDVVFTDPPWIEPQFTDILIYACKLAKVNGNMIIGTYPEYRHQTALEDSMSIYRTMIDNNLVPQVILPDQIFYRNKPVLSERTTDYSSNTDIDWMKGTFVLAEKIAPTSATKQDLTSKINSEWQNFLSGKSKIALRVSNDNNYTLPKLIPITDDESRFILPSDPLSADVDLWTSGNQVFKVYGINVFKRLLQLVLENKKLDECATEISQQFDIPLKMVKKDIHECYMATQELLKNEQKLYEK